jgi:hypothetical protein
VYLPAELMLVGMDRFVLFLILTIPLWVTACSSDPAPDKEKEKKVMNQVRLSCLTEIDSVTASPKSEVFLLLDEVKVKVADIMACDPIPEEDFASYDIPAGALSACGGWWAGGGDYLYVVADDRGYEVWKGWQEELQEDEGFHFEVVYRWEHPGK